MKVLEIYGAVSDVISYQVITSESRLRRDRPPK